MVGVRRRRADSIWKRKNLKWIRPLTVVYFKINGKSGDAYYRHLSHSRPFVKGRKLIIKIELESSSSEFRTLFRDEELRLDRQCLHLITAEDVSPTSKIIKQN